MNCNICGEPIVLSPSAKERAKRFGGKPSDYTKIFTTHSECALQKREQETRDLMRRINARVGENRDPRILEPRAC